MISKSRAHRLLDGMTFLDEKLEVIQSNELKQQKLGKLIILLYFGKFSSLMHVLLNAIDHSKLLIFLYNFSRYLNIFYNSQGILFNKMP